MRTNKVSLSMGALAMVVVLAGPRAKAFADQVPAPAPASAEVAASKGWRQYALPATLVGAGLGVAATVGFTVLQNSRQNAFNDHRDPLCVTSRPDNGGPGCTALLDDARSAQTWAKVGLGAAVGFGAAALVLWLTNPPEKAAQETRVACAPGLGLSAACAVTF